MWKFWQSISTDQRSWIIAFVSLWISTLVVGGVAIFAVHVN
jgi:hypothetical protein